MANKKDKPKKNAKDSNIEDTAKHYIPEHTNSTVYGEYYNKNVVYIYKDNSTVRVTYDSKNTEYIERKYK